MSEAHEHSGDGALLLSICIPTYNRADRLRETLESMTSLRVPAGVRFELFVCDNNCTDDTKQVVESFFGKFEEVFGDSFVGSLHYVFEEKAGRSHALNRLLTEVSGSWMVTADDDILVPAGWLEAYVEGMARYPDAVCFGGPMEPRVPVKTTPGQRMLMQAYPAVFALVSFEGDQPIDPDRVITAGANMALRRDVIPEEGFDPSLGVKGNERRIGEDVVMVQHVLGDGGEGWMLSRAGVKHYVHPNRLSLAYLWSWQRACGRMWVLNRGKPTPGKFGVAWWAWSEYMRRVGRMVLRWRPWPDEAFHEAVVDAAQYWGYLTAK